MSRVFAIFSQARVALSQHVCSTWYQVRGGGGDLSPRGKRKPYRCRASYTLLVKLVMHHAPTAGVTTISN